MHSPSEMLIGSLSPSVTVSLSHSGKPRHAVWSCPGFGVIADSVSCTEGPSASVWSHWLRTPGPWEDAVGGAWADPSCWTPWTELRLGTRWAWALHAGWGLWFPFLSSALQGFSLPDYWPRQQRRLGCPGWGNTVTTVHVHWASWAPGAVLWLDSKPLSVQSALHTPYALFPEEKCSEMSKRGERIKYISYSI